MQCAVTGTVGSNPTLSADGHGDVTVDLAVALMSPL